MKREEKWGQTDTHTHTHTHTDDTHPGKNYSRQRNLFRWRQKHYNFYGKLSPTPSLIRHQGRRRTSPRRCLSLMQSQFHIYTLPFDSNKSASMVYVRTDCLLNSLLKSHAWSFVFCFNIHFVSFQKSFFFPSTDAQDASLSRPIDRLRHNSAEQIEGMSQLNYFIIVI